MMVLRWRLTFSLQSQICFPIHLYGLLLLRIHIFDSSSKYHDLIEMELAEEHRGA